MILAKQTPPSKPRKQTVLVEMTRGSRCLVVSRTLPCWPSLSRQRGVLLHLCILRIAVHQSIQPANGCVLFHDCHHTRQR